MAASIQIVGSCLPLGDVEKEFLNQCYQWANDLDEITNGGISVKISSNILVRNRESGVNKIMTATFQLNGKFIDLVQNTMLSEVSRRSLFIGLDLLACKESLRFNDIGRMARERIERNVSSPFDSKA